MLSQNFLQIHAGTVEDSKKGAHITLSPSEGFYQKALETVVYTHLLSFLQIFLLNRLEGLIEPRQRMLKKTVLCQNL